MGVLGRLAGQENTRINRAPLAGREHPDSTVLPGLATMNFIGWHWSTIPGILLAHGTVREAVGRMRVAKSTSQNQDAQMWYAVG